MRLDHYGLAAASLDLADAVQDFLPDVEVILELSEGSPGKLLTHSRVPPSVAGECGLARSPSWLWRTVSAARSRRAPDARSRSRLASTRSAEGLLFGSFPFVASKRHDLNSLGAPAPGNK